MNLRKNLDTTLSPSKQSLKNDHKAMIFLHTEKEPVHDYVRQALFLVVSS